MGNEEDLCEALIQILEEDFDRTRADVTYPERDTSGPPVEIRFRIGDRQIAIEHTLIEPFPRAIQSGKEFQELTEDIVAQLDGAMPKPGIYELKFPVHPTEGHHRRTHAQIRAQIVEWATEAGTLLHAEFPERLDKNHSPHGFYGTRTTEIEGIPLSLSRQVHWSVGDRHDGRLFQSRIVGDDVEDLRVVRMRTALQKKLPKLAECAVLGDTTFLILEWFDVALTNQINVAAALETALAERDDWPDYVLLADTTCETWHFFRPLANGAFSIDMEYIEIDRSRLQRDDAPVS